MKFNYKLSNLVGCVYKQGNIVFTPDGNSVLSPVSNRVTVFDLVNHQSSTLPFENLRNISAIALSPNGSTLISVDEEGHALLVNLVKRVVLADFHFKKPVRDIKFSPDGKYFAVTHGRHVQVWLAPPLITEFRPFTLHRTYTGHHDDVTCIEWSDDSQFLVSGSRDNTARLYSLHPIDGFIPLQLAGHHSAIVGVFFGTELEADRPPCSTLYTVSKDGSVFTWRFSTFAEKKEAKEQEGAEGKKGKRGATHARHKKLRESHASLAAAEAKKASGEEGDDEEGGSAVARLTDASLPPYLSRGSFSILRRQYADHKNAKVRVATLHRTKAVNLLIIGLSSGVFQLYELPDFNCIQELSISQQNITAVAVNNTGEWLAFGSAALGQLLVWEWQSGTHVLKQQGHYYDVNTLSYSPDGQIIATGGDDGKVKLWNTNTGFCFVTFASHTAPVNHVEFSASGTVVFSSSLDGTVRAHDLVRYRNFRTMTSPQPTQFMSMAVDPSGEIVCAGSVDPFEIYVWSVQTGRLLDVLAGHTAPVSGLAFSGSQALLASCSWDGTAKVWDPYTGKGLVETFTHSSDVLALAFSPNGKELCTSCLDGQLYFWDTYNFKLKFQIECKKDVLGGRRSDDARTAKTSTLSPAFTSLCYSADGTCVLAGGNSKFVCIYAVEPRILLRKFPISRNRSLDGVLNFLNSRNVTDAGPLDSLDVDDEDPEELKDRLDASLPGAKRADFSSRKTKPVARTKCVRFSPTGQQWSAATTEGLLIYSLDDQLAFDPTDLDMDITPQNVQLALERKQFGKALLMSLSLNEAKLIEACMEATPSSEISLIARSVPLHRVQRLLDVIAARVAASPHLEFYLVWAQALLTVHGQHLRKTASKYLTTLRGLHKALNTQHKDIAKICDDNHYLLDFLASFSGRTNATASSSSSSSSDDSTPAAPAEDGISPTSDSAPSGGKPRRKRTGLEEKERTADEDADLLASLAAATVPMDDNEDEEEDEDEDAEDKEVVLPPVKASATAGKQRRPERQESVNAKGKDDAAVAVGSKRKSSASSAAPARTTSSKGSVSQLKSKKRRT